MECWELSENFQHEWQNCEQEHSRFEHGMGCRERKNNNQKYEIPILKVVGPSMLIATDPKFQFGFAVQMWKVVEKPFI